MIATVKENIQLKQIWVKFTTQGGNVHMMNAILKNLPIEAKCEN